MLLYVKDKNHILDEKLCVMFKNFERRFAEV